MAKALMPSSPSSHTLLLLIQPLLILLAVWALLPKAQPTLWVDVPVIIISPDGSERVLWQGEDRMEIQQNIDARMTELASILFSNPKNPDLVRQRISDGLKQFSQDTGARQAYLGLASRSLNLAMTSATSFVREASEIRYLENEHKWDSELRGTWTWTDEGSGNVKAQKLRLSLSFRPAESLQKSKTKRALSISDLKVAYED